MTSVVFGGWIKKKTWYFLSVTDCWFNISLPKPFPESRSTFLKKATQTKKMKNQSAIFFYSTHSSSLSTWVAYITHNATQPLTVEVQVCHAGWGLVLQKWIPCVKVHVCVTVPRWSVGGGGGASCLYYCTASHLFVHLQTCSLITSCLLLSQFIRLQAAPPPPPPQSPKDL